MFSGRRAPGPGAILTLDGDQRQRLLAHARSLLAPCDEVSCNEVIRLAARASAKLAQSTLGCILGRILPARIDRRRSRRLERAPEPDSGLRLPSVDSKRIKTSPFLLNDIASTACPEIISLWEHLKSTDTNDFEFHEFTAQYESVGKAFLGIGVMKKKVDDEQ